METSTAALVAPGLIAMAVRLYTKLQGRRAPFVDHGWFRLRAGQTSVTSSDGVTIRV
jgi:hypothetical protein